MTTPYVSHFYTIFARIINIYDLIFFARFGSDASRSVWLAVAAPGMVYVEYVWADIPPGAFRRSYPFPCFVPRRVRHPTPLVILCA